MYLHHSSLKHCICLILCFCFVKHNWDKTGIKEFRIVFILLCHPNYQENDISQSSEVPHSVSVPW